MAKKIWGRELRDSLKKKKIAYQEDQYNSYKDICGNRDPTPGDVFTEKYKTATV